MVRALCGLLAFFVAAWLPESFRPGCVVWLLGVLLWWGMRCLRVGLWWRIPTTLVLGLTLLASRMNRLPDWNGFGADVLLGLTFAGFAWSFGQRITTQESFSVLKRCGTFLSDISYTLYLVHFPCVVLLGATLYGKNQLSPGFWAYLQFALWLAVLLCIAVAMWWGFEKRTPWVRDYLQRRVGKPR